MQEYGMFTYRREHVGCLGPFQYRLRRRHERLVLQVGAVELVQDHHVTAAQRRIERDHLFGSDLEVLREDLADPWRHVRRHRDTHDRAEAAPADTLLDRGEKIVGLEFLDRDVCIARDPERVCLHDLHPGKQAAKMSHD